MLTFSRYFATIINVSALYRKILLCFPLLILGMEIAAQEIRALTLEEACNLAEQNSISLQKQAIDLEWDRVRAKNLWAQVFPTISAGAGARYTIPLNSSADAADPYYTATIDLRLGLSAGLPFTMANISLAYKNSLLNYEQARHLLINQTSKSFYSLVAQKNNLSVLEGTVRLATEQLDRDRISRQNGYIGELDFLSSQISAERAKISYNRALADYENALAKFCAAIGLDQNEKIEPEGKVEIGALSLDAEALINDKLSMRPDITAQRNEIERLQNAYRESLFASKGPSLNLTGSWEANSTKGPGDTISAGIALSIPIDPWIPKTKVDQTVKRANAEYQKARLELQNTENSARQEIRSLAASISNTWAEVETARLQAGFAQRAYELASQGYRMGTMNFLNFETIRNRLTEARQQLLQSELNYKILVLDLASSLNMEERELQNYSR